METNIPSRANLEAFATAKSLQTATWSDLGNQDLFKCKIEGICRHRPTARSLQTVKFSNGQGAGYQFEWTIISRPEGSRSQLSNTFAAEPELWLDLAGTYEIELDVRDTDGFASCAPSIVTIHAVPSQHIHIQLTWNAPAVPNPVAGRGTDLDLHYQHPLAQGWNDAVYDIYWRNAAQNWGSTANPSPVTLDIDDQWGNTTENINHKNPQNLTYTVGVHFFQDNGLGDAKATVRIYLHGQLAAEFPDELMKHRYFWEVAAIQWPSGNIIPINSNACAGTFPGFGNEQCR